MIVVYFSNNQSHLVAENSGLKNTGKNTGNVCHILTHRTTIFSQIPNILSPSILNTTYIISVSIYQQENWNSFTMSFKQHNHKKNITCIQKNVLVDTGHSNCSPEGGLSQTDRNVRMDVRAFSSKCFAFLDLRKNL